MISRSFSRTEVSAPSRVLNLSGLKNSKVEPEGGMRLQHVEVAFPHVPFAACQPAWQPPDWHKFGAVQAPPPQTLVPGILLHPVLQICPIQVLAAVQGLVGTQPVQILVPGTELQPLSHTEPMHVVAAVQLLVGTQPVQILVPVTTTPQFVVQVVPLQVLAAVQVPSGTQPPQIFVPGTELQPLSHTEPMHVVAAVQRLVGTQPPGPTVTVAEALAFFPAAF